MSIVTDHSPQVLSSQDKGGQVESQGFVFGPANEDMMDNISTQSLEFDTKEGDKGWKVSRSRKAKKRKQVVVVATRTSQRVPRDGVPIAVKAANCAMAKDNISGTSSNPFTILNDTSSTVLKDVLLDLDIEAENLDDQIDAFKAEELARAAIAEANYKYFLEKQLEKSSPVDDDVGFSHGGHFQPPERLFSCSQGG
jgi:hypothetical protein